MKKIKCRRECCQNGVWHGRSESYSIAVPEIYINFDAEKDDKIPDDVLDQIFNDVGEIFDDTSAVTVDQEEYGKGIIIRTKCGDERQFVPKVIARIKRIIKKRTNS